VPGHRPLVIEVDSADLDRVMTIGAQLLADLSIPLRGVGVAVEVPGQTVEVDEDLADGVVAATQTVSPSPRPQKLRNRRARQAASAPPTPVKVCASSKTRKSSRA
jgi:hypothetical protein